MKRLILFTVFVLAVGTVSTADRSARAMGQGPQLFLLKLASAPSLCLEPIGGTGAFAGSWVTLEPCNGAIEQLWSFNGSVLQWEGGGYCLDVTATPVAQIHPQLEPCSGSAPQQQWSPIALSPPSETWSADSSNPILDMRANTEVAGTDVVLSTPSLDFGDLWTRSNQ